MKKATSKFPLLILLSAAGAAIATQAPVSPYVGQELREIKSLSAEDIEQIRTGQGWGLAKAAELNGVPGPRHVLQLSNELELSARQKQGVETEFENMRSGAVRVGADLLRSESQLEQAFRQNSIDADQLRTLLEAAALAKAELRYVHLSSHLQMLQILTPEQLATYNELRGYHAQHRPH